MVASHIISRSLLLAIFSIFASRVNIVGGQCIAGQYQGTNACESCASGQFQSSDTFTGNTCAVWSVCAAGEKQNVAPSLSVNRGCTDCDAGKFQTSEIFTGISCVRTTCLLFLFYLKIFKLLCSSFSLFFFSLSLSITKS